MKIELTSYSCDKSFGPYWKLINNKLFRVIAGERAYIRKRMFARAVIKKKLVFLWRSFRRNGFDQSSISEIDWDNYTDIHTLTRVILYFWTIFKKRIKTLSVKVAKRQIVFWDYNMYINILQYLFFIFDCK